MELDTVDKTDLAFELKTLPKKTFEIKVVVPWSVVAKNQQHALSHLAESTEIKGFRKGKAPIEIVKKSITPSALYEATLDHLLPSVYQQAITKYDLKPVVDPKVRAVSTEDKKDWEFTFTLCELPEITLGDYKTGITESITTQAIWTPGQPKTDKKELTPEEKRSQKITNSLRWLVDNSKLEISDLLIESERGRKLSRLVGDLQKLGLTLEQYLSNTGKTSDQLVIDYNKESENELKVEMLLQKLADEEKLTVEPAEIDKIIDEAKTPEEKSALEKQKYLLSSMVRRQKTLDFLANL